MHYRGHWGRDTTCSASPSSWSPPPRPCPPSPAPQRRRRQSPSHTPPAAAGPGRQAPAPPPPDPRGPAATVWPPPAGRSGWVSEPPNHRQRGNRHLSMWALQVPVPHVTHFYRTNIVLRSSSNHAIFNHVSNDYKKSGFLKNLKYATLSFVYQFFSHHAVDGRW